MSQQSSAIRIERNKSRAKWRTRGFLVSVWIYPIILFAILYVYINFRSFLMAFQKVNTDTYEFEWYGVNNFINFISDLTKADNMRFVVTNTLVAFGAGLLISMPISILISYFLYKKIYLSGILNGVLFLPTIISAIVWVILFKYFVEYGVPALCKSLNINYSGSLLSDPNKQFGTILFYNMWLGLPGSMLIYLGTMTRIPASLVEAGKLDGMGIMRELFSVTIPLSFPVISVTLITSIAGFFTNQLNLYAFFQEFADFRSYTLGYYLFALVIRKTDTIQLYPYASAAGLLFTVVAVPLTLLTKWALEKFGPDAEF